MQAYDLVVIGSGTAAQVVSAKVRKAGRTVAVVDHRPFGGTCALRGCDPKKMLISGAETIDAAQRMQGHGVTGELRIGWRELIAFKRTFTDPVPQKQEAHYAAQGIDAFHGIARFTGPDAVSVEGQELKARHIVIATGARPVPLQFLGAEHIITSDRFLELESLPGRIVLIGGGYVAAEFSHIAARAGAQVTVFQRADRMLPRFDPDLVGWLMVKFAELGIDVRTRSTVDRIEQTANGLLVHADGQQSVAADLVVHAAGREPDLGMDLAAAQVTVSKKRLELNEYLQSVSNPQVYAAGDAASLGPPLTPVSAHDGRVVATNILEGNSRKPDYRGVPSVAFTIPPIASVGLTESQARTQGLKFKVNSENTPNWYTARRLAERVYGYKTLVEEGTGRILGAHIVGPHADEVINLFGLAMRHNLTARDLQTTMFAYPTGASDIGSMV
ncbi:NAD(P)/FAD-dependent oxidoreductase [Bradyrhizobium sp. CCBAU 53351]|uniref:dihydrolipoyl dehydrogenase family protein n=1 Tax=Bradyrhizobium sp. CCBAU 53351 TaxID=1325114 RepID=UPI001886FB4F|nr:NAD(P)/FAD-dependent oxidoreductase [Bradyrhizobium sp. CCBAU 53351]QOZ74084.1 NAD(P)/FAD-dependent oxidoreductase [Bradyrhizobium sp. CCBAU 53351]